MTHTLDQFDFDLPPELIAQHPAAERAASRLLQVVQAPAPAGGTTAASLVDRAFRDLATLLRDDDLLVFNDTRVIKARFFGEKDSGGKIEVLVERITDATQALAQIRASKSPKPGSRLRLENAFEVVVDGRDGEFFRVTLADAHGPDWWTRCEAHGRLPLPPYITHDAQAEDDERYQTVYSRHPGAVAAPTAGLHFDEPLLAELGQRGIQLAWLTLHVGAGTFQPVRVNDLSQHQMHCEHYTIPADTAAAIASARARGGRVIAVGTTSLRALEAAALAAETASQLPAETASQRPAETASRAAADPPAAQGAASLPQAGSGETRLFILPGYRFRVVDALITNFHLPKSTLLMLVSAFAGSQTIRDAYRHAIAQRYRFFSYGDAMLLERNDHAL